MFGIYLNHHKLIEMESLPGSKPATQMEDTVAIQPLSPERPIKERGQGLDLWVWSYKNKSKQPKARNGGQ